MNVHKVDFPAGTEARPPGCVTHCRDRNFVFISGRPTPRFHYLTVARAWPLLTLENRPALPFQDRSVISVHQPPLRQNQRNSSQIKPNQGNSSLPSGPQESTAGPLAVRAGTAVSPLINGAHSLVPDRSNSDHFMALHLHHHPCSPVSIHGNKMFLSMPSYPGNFALKTLCFRKNQDISRIPDNRLPALEIRAHVHTLVLGDMSAVPKRRHAAAPHMAPAATTLKHQYRDGWREFPFKSSFIKIYLDCHPSRIRYSDSGVRLPPQLEVSRRVASKGVSSVSSLAPVAAPSFWRVSPAGRTRDS